MRMPTMHQTPFLRVLIPMIVGIALFNWFENEWIGISFLSMAFFIFIGTCFIKKANTAYQLRYLTGISIIFAFIGIGFLFSYLKDKESKFDFADVKKIYRAEIISIPEIKERSVYCQLNIKAMDETKSKTIVSYFHKDRLSEKLRQGDKLLINTHPKKLINTNRPGSFDYSKYLHRQGFSGTCYIDTANWKKLNSTRSFNLIYLAADLREKILEIFRSFNFKENEFALLSGITIGYKDALTMEQKNCFSAVGLSHLMAVSGMQTAMVFSMIWFLLGFIDKRSRFYRFKYIVVIIGLWIFTYITGLSASVVRASIMLTVLMAGGIFNRQVNTLNSLAFSAFCILLYNPFTLFDIGFQLSYLAVIAILIAQDIIGDRFQNMHHAPKFFLELIVMTLAAQLGTSPLSVFYFHQFPLLFLLANLIILPFNSALVYLATFCASISAIKVPYMWFGDVLQFMLSSLDYVTAFLSKFPYSQIKNLYPSVYDVALFYLLLSFALLFLYKKEKRYFFFGLITLILLEGSIVMGALEKKKENRILIYNQFGKNRIEKIRNGEVSIIEENAFIFKGKRFFRINRNIKNIVDGKKLKCDYLILEKGFKGKPEQLQQLFDYKLVIIDASLSLYYSQLISKSEIKCYNIADKGAFEL